MSKQKNKYYVIGGQYECYCHGGAPTLLGAKRLAGRSMEFWDNWQGWNIPSVYRVEDTEICNNFYGTNRCPVDGAHPVAVAEYDNGKIKWFFTDEDGYRMNCWGN